MKSFVILLIASFSGIANCHAIIPDTVYIRKPESMGLIYRNLEVITNDGYKIETWFFPAQNPPSESELRNPNENRRTHEAPGEAKRPTIIICNGDAGNIPETTPKELMIVENAAHGGKEDPILIAFDDFINRTSDFLMANLRPLHGEQPSATE